MAVIANKQPWYEGYHIILAGIARDISVDCEN